MTYKLKIKEEGIEKYSDYIEDNTKKNIYKIIEIWMKISKTDRCSYEISEEVSIEDIKKFNGEINDL